MKKRALPLLLAMLLLLGLFSACAPDMPEGSSAPEGSEDITTLPEQTEPAPDLSDPTKEGRLWYYENFDGIELSDDNMTTISSLGWSYNMTTDATMKPQTAQYKIVDHDGSRRLYIQNYDGDKKANDSFVTLLTDRQFGYLQGSSYTYQYDLTYADAENDSRYIAMISEYNGSDYYNSVHIRNSGYGNNECYAFGEWKQYDTSITSKGNDSLAKKLLGKAPAKDVLKGISISIRCAVNWETGNKVYIRVNTEGFPESGKWTLVSEAKPKSSASVYIDPELGGNAIAIKTGGKQNGYIDNIIIWSGNGDEPADKSSPLIGSKTKCHQITDDGGKRLCILCGKTEAELSGGWLLGGVPEYEGGVLSEALYLTGQGKDYGLARENEGEMQIVSATSEKAFLAYAEKLASESWASEFSRDADGNLYRSYIKDGTRVYTYYIGAEKEVRIIKEPLSVSLSPSEFGYEYTPKEGEFSAVYQYALPMRDATHSSSDGYIDCGMLYVIKLADDSVIVIDGASGSQFPTEQIENFMSFLREITGAGEQGKVRIAAWYMTHAHGDHYQGFISFIKKYSKQVALERMIFNNPSSYSENSALSGLTNGFINTMKNLNVAYGDTKYIKPHTGMTITLADVKLEILYTHEDLTDPYTCKSGAGSNSNEASLVSKITFGGGKTLLLLGDIDCNAGYVIFKNHSAEALKCDVLQMSHHVLNDLSGIYDKAQATVILIPQSLHRMMQHSVSPTAYATVLKYASKSMCFFQNEYTVGIGAPNGELKKIYTRDIVYKIKK